MVLTPEMFATELQGLWRGAAGGQELGSMGRPQPPPSTGVGWDCIVSEVVLFSERGGSLGFLWLAGGSFQEDSEMIGCL